MKKVYTHISIDAQCGSLSWDGGRGANGLKTFFDFACLSRYTGNGTVTYALRVARAYDPRGPIGWPHTVGREGDGRLTNIGTRARAISHVFRRL